MAKIKEYIFHIFLLLVLCFWYPLSFAQNKFSLIILPVDKTPEQIASFNFPVSFNSKNACFGYINNLSQTLLQKGYASASVDSMWEDSLNVYCRLFTGDKFLWDSIRASEESWQTLAYIEVNKKNFNTKPFDQNIITSTFNKLLEWFQNNGYPFAKIYFDSICINNGLITATLNIEKNQQYFIDSIHISGKARISKDFLYRFLDIQPHELYNKGKLDKINIKLAQLSYIEQAKPWSVSMLNSGAILNLHLDARRSNQINLLVGFLPSNPQLGGKLLVTGEATADLKNPFGKGETIAAHWQQLQPKSPRLDLAFQRPFIFHSPFGISFNFQLYKRDSSYLNINAQIGLQYILSSKQSGTVYLQTAKTNLLDIDTNTIKLTKSLPPNIDMSTTGIAFQYNFNNTNYPFNPRSGNDLQILTGFGSKKIKKNNTILNIKDPLFNYNNLYDTVKLKSYQAKLRTTYAHYFPIGKQATIKTAVNAGWFYSPNYFQNELFQIGGYKLLRGFDEESIYTNAFAVATLEYRYLLSQNSFLFGFADFGKAQYKNAALQYSHTYLGIGAGIAFETNAGIFNISFAEGKRNDASFNFRNSKIHLGFVSLF